MSANVALSETFDQWRVKTNELMVMTQTDGSSNFLKLTNTTNSTSNGTGSIITAGGIGVAKSMVIGENVNVHGNLHANGNITSDGDLTLGDADTDTITFAADIGSSLEPNANVTYHFGNSTMYWANGYFESMNLTQASDSGYVALVIDADDADKQVVTIDGEQTTVNVFQIDADALTTGTLMYLKSDVNDASTRNLLEVVNEHTSATGTTALELRNDAGRGLFIDSNLAAGGYSVEVDSEHTTTNVAKIASIATSGTLLELSAAGVLTGDVINITADSATTGKGINMSMDALTTGSGIYLDDNSASTGTRKTVEIIQNNAAALAATALQVQSDGGITGMTLDKNFTDVSAATVTGLHVDFDRTVPGSGTATFTDIGIDLDVNSAGLGTTTTTGLDVDVVGATSGTHTATGINIAVGSADTNYALITSGGNVGISTAAPASVLHVTGTVQVGIDGTGHDVYFYGDSASSNLFWDEGNNRLTLNDSDLYVNQDDNYYAINVDSESGSYAAVNITSLYGFHCESDISNGWAARFVRNIAEGGNYPLVRVEEQHASGTQTAFKIENAGSGLAADFRGPAGTGTATAGTLRLSTAELTVVDADQLGRIEFGAPLESSGTSAIVAGAAIWAEADDTFASDNNNTDLVFATAANGAATEKMRIDSTGQVTFADGAIDVNIASHDTSNGLKLGGTLVTATAAEINKLDGVGTLSEAGKQTIWVPATSMSPTETNGCSSLTAVEGTAARPNMQVLDFDKDSDEHAQFSVAFPKAWNLGTVKFQAFWTGIAATTGVHWAMQGVAITDNESIDTAYGTQAGADDSSQGSATELLVTAESAAITIAGTPAAGDLVFFRVFRDVSNGHDDMNGDARLHGIKVLYTTDAKNDSN